MPPPANSKVMNTATLEAVVKNMSDGKF